MKKIILFICLFLFPVVVNAQDLKINELIIEGEKLELKDGVYEYDLTLSDIYSKLSIVVDVDDNISYEIEGNDGLSVGNNTINIKLSDGVNNTNYTINILKMADDPIELSNNNKLKNLSISGYPLGFESDVLEYNLTIKSEAKLRINYVKESDEAEVYIDGNENLVDGSVIRVKVVAQSGDVREYKINIHATETRLEIEEDIEEKVDYKLIAYIVAAALIAIFLVIINLSGKK